MDTETRTIAIELPAGIADDEQTQGVLRTALQALACLGPRSACRCEDLSHLQAGGWEVGWGLTWVVQARREGALEEAFGTTREEACARLRQFCRLHEVTGTP